VTLLSREAILGADDLRTQDVDVPEWGGKVRIRSLTAHDRDAIETAVYGAQKEGKYAPENVRALYAAGCIVDEKGDPLFSAADVEALGRKSAAALNRVYEAVLELNAIAEGDIEELAKN
jgi:hypothetical protein